MQCADVGCRLWTVRPTPGSSIRQSIYRQRSFKSEFFQIPGITDPVNDREQTVSPHRRQNAMPDAAVKIYALSGRGEKSQRASGSTVLMSCDRYEEAVSVQWKECLATIGMPLK